MRPHPVRLVRSAHAPLSAMALLGRELFFDPSLSSSGRLSCASCHSPQHAYGPPGDKPAMRGGPALALQGTRAVPSLMYLERNPPFSIGPDDPEADNEGAPSSVAAPATGRLVPQGGLFWDGRVDTLQGQALEPIQNPREMDGGSVTRVAAALRRAAYAPEMGRLFGSAIFAQPRMLVSEALFAIARYQIEEPSFHPYTSKYDAWLEGKANLSPAELRGYRAFDDPRRGNCAACHLDRPTRNGLPPLFTDHQYEALAVPRNPELTANRDSAYFDLGVCGPVRRDLRAQTQYCGMFATPTLRNVATRRAFFHNGRYRTLADAVRFYALRDTDPARIYPHRRDGSVARFDDLPARFVGNVDTVDAPFGPGHTPLADAEQRDIVAFLQTLTDGYRPAGGKTAAPGRTP